MDLYGFIWIYMGLYGFIWVYMDLYGFIWIYMDLYGFIWIYMDLYGFIWIYMDKNMGLYVWKFPIFDWIYIYIDHLRSRNPSPSVPNQTATCLLIKSFIDPPINKINKPGLLENPWKIHHKSDEFPSFWKNRHGFWACSIHHRRDIGMIWWDPAY